MSKTFVNAESRRLKKNRVYLSESDLLAQQTCSISGNELEEKLKILALLHDQITIPVSHILHSRKTFNLLKRHPTMLRKEIIVPTIDSRYSSFEEYIDASLTRDYYKLASKSKHSNLVAEFLEDNTKIAIKWDFVSQVDKFKESFLWDISNPDSILRKKLEPDDIKIIKTMFLREEFTTRSFALSITEKLKPESQVVYINYVNSLYHLNGSCHHKAFPNLHHLELPYIENKFQISLEYPSDIKFDSNKLFKEFLRSVNIPCTTLHKLNDQNIINLRKDTITSGFRRKFNETIDRVAAGKDELDGIAYEFQDIKAEFREALENEIEKEVLRDDKYQKSKRYVKFVAYATNFLHFVGEGLIPEKALITGIGLGTVYNIKDPLINWLRNFIGCEFIIFKEEYSKETLLK